jgi:hypothetical protein
MKAHEAVFNWFAGATNNTSNFMHGSISLAIGSPWFLTLIAGIFFGLWPFLISRGGLKGFDSVASMALLQAAIILGCTAVSWYLGGDARRSILLALAVTVLIILYADKQWRIDAANWNYIIATATASAIGLLCVCRLNQIVNLTEVAPFLVTIYVLQIAVSMTVHFSQNPSEISVMRGLGYVTAAISVLMLHKRW